MQFMANALQLIINVIVVLISLRGGQAGVN